MDQFEATAEAIAGRVGIEPDQVAAILRERTRFVRAERQQDALEAAAQALVAAANDSGTPDLVATGKLVRWVDPARRHIRRPGRAGGKDIAQRIAVMRLAYTPAEQQAAILLTNPNALTRSVANVQAQTGLSRRDVQKVKDSLPRLKIAVKMIFNESDA